MNSHWISPSMYKMLTSNKVDDKLNLVVQTVEIFQDCDRPSGVVSRGAGCRTKGPWFKSRVRHECQTVSQASLVAERFCAKTQQTGDARFNPRLTYLFKVFRGFLRNSSKYGLRSLRKTPTVFIIKSLKTQFETIGLKNLQNCT